MSETDALTPDDLLTAEFALGVLDGDQHRDALQRLAEDHEFAASVDAWSVLLASMIIDTPAVPAPAAAREKILTRIFGASPPLRKTQSAGEKITRATKEARQAAALIFWKGATAAFAALALVALGLSAILITDARPERNRFSLVATLVPPEAPSILSVRINPETGALEIVDAALQQALETADQATELWLIPEGGPPQSLGLINSVGSSSLAVANLLRGELRPGSILAISVEPLGGSPTGAPTGPVIAIGALRERAP